MDRFFGLDKPSIIDEELEHLGTANDRVYLAIVTGLLDEAEIPYLVKERGSAMNIIGGYSFFGSDIYVHKDRLEEAVTLLSAYEEADDFSDGDFEEEADENSEDDED